MKEEEDYPPGSCSLCYKGNTVGCPLCCLTWGTGWEAHCAPVYSEFLVRFQLRRPGCCFRSPAQVYCFCRFPGLCCSLCLCCSRCLCCCSPGGGWSCAGMEGFPLGCRWDILHAAYLQYRVFIKYCVFSLKFCDFSELCQFCCSASVLPAWCVYTH